MALFRKSSAPSDSTSVSDDLDPSGKGRATPSRKQAEAERKERLKATARGEIKSRARGGASSGSGAATSREERKSVRQRMLEGDDRVLSARDRGPERRYARDLVDGRRTVGEFFLYIAFGILFISFVGIPILQVLSQVLLLATIVALACDSYRIHKLVDRAVREKFPNGNVDGVARYAMMRGISLRRMRVPKPQVSPSRRGSARA